MMDYSGGRGMLNINNKDDIEKMMCYHRARDMINLMRYFPDLSPIKNLTIVTSIDDYLKNYDFCKDFPGERNDTLISKPPMRSVEGAGINPDIVSIFKDVKELDSDGVMVLFDLCHEPSERYDRYAGISVLVSVGNGIVIDAVGKGFDGREVSKGIASHERYFIPWINIRSCNISNFKDYRTYIISDHDYKKSRNDRIEFLCSLGLPIEDVLKNVPLEYSEIPDFIWLDVLKNLIKRLDKMDYELLSCKLSDFVINGHTEGKRFLPWQMYDKCRYFLTKK